jgi:hypothetical protein
VLGFVTVWEHNIEFLLFKEPVTFLTLVNLNRSVLLQGHELLRFTSLLVLLVLNKLHSLREREELIGLVFLENKPRGDSLLAELGDELPFTEHFLALVLLTALGLGARELEPLESLEVHSALFLDQGSELRVSRLLTEEKLEGLLVDGPLTGISRLGKWLDVGRFLVLGRPREEGAGTVLRESEESELAALVELPGTDHLLAAFRFTLGRFDGFVEDASSDAVLDDGSSVFMASELLDWQALDLSVLDSGDGALFTFEEDVDASLLSFFDNDLLAVRSLASFFDDLLLAFTALLGSLVAFFAWAGALFAFGSAFGDTFTLLVSVGVFTLAWLDALALNSLESFFALDDDLFADGLASSKSELEAELADGDASDLALVDSLSEG